MGAARKWPQRYSGAESSLARCPKHSRMLRLRVLVYPGARLEVKDVQGSARAVRLREPLSTQRPENTNKHDLKFRALLTEGGAERLELVRA